MLTFDTARAVRIRSVRLALLYYALVVAILAYVGVYSLYLQRGYQRAGPVSLSVDAKVKGFARAADGVVFDATELVGLETHGFFLDTSLQQTWQTRGTCPRSDRGEERGVCLHTGLGVAPPTPEPHRHPCRRHRGRGGQRHGVTRIAQERNWCG